MPRRIVHNGIVMIEGWPERMEEAQQIFEYEIGGAPYPRIPYGADEYDLHADRLPCHDCFVPLGHLHVPGCDAERCPACGLQAIGCGCGSDDE